MGPLGLGLEGESFLQQVLLFNQTNNPNKENKEEISLF